MKKINFEWDENKNKLNLKKHKIDFDEAKTVFYDSNARIINDPEHSDEEERFLLLGFSLNFKILIVCHCFRNDDKNIRIISARKADKQEQKYYKEVNKL
jgi:uncharacterized DUF497 family protein